MMNGPTGNVPVSSHRGPLHLERRKQINTLLIFNENVSEVKPNQEYRVDFEAGGNKLAMIIILPLEFPTKKPSIRIEHSRRSADDSIPGSLSHPWLDVSGNVVGAPGLNSYSSHSDLGRVVQAIKRSLERDPPTFRRLEHAPSNFQNQLHPSFLPQMNRGPNPGYAAHNPISDPNPDFGQRTGHVPRPASQTVIPEVAELSLDELRELEGDEKAVLNFTKGLKNSTSDAMTSRSQSLQKSIAEKMKQNQSLAEEVKSKEESLKRGIKTRDELCGEISALEAQVMEVRSKNTFSSVEDELKGQWVKLEDRSEEVADEFLSGKLSMEDFIKSYVKVRSSHNEVKAKFDDVANTNRHLRNFEAMNYR